MSLINLKTGCAIPILDESEDIDLSRVRGVGSGMMDRFKSQSKSVYRGRYNLLVSVSSENDLNENICWVLENDKKYGGRLTRVDNLGTITMEIPVNL